MKNKTGSIFEIIWFVLGGLLLFMGIDVASGQGFSEAWYYFLFSALAFVMYYLRRRMRLSKS
jgi:hypothetical protein